jgi:type IV pilus assembly protein PilQ
MIPFRDKKIWGRVLPSLAKRERAELPTEMILQSGLPSLAKRKRAQPPKRMTLRLSLPLLIVLQTLPPAQILAAEVANIDSVQISPDEVHIKMSSSETYDSFLLKAPPRLVVEIQNTHYTGKEKSIRGKGRYLKDVRAAQFKDHPLPISRIVFDLTEITPYRITNKGKSLLIVLGEDKAKASEVSLSLDTAQNPQITPFPSEGPQQNLVASAPLPTVPVDVTSAKHTQNQFRAKRPPLDVDILSRLSHDPISIDFENMDIRDVLKLLAAKSKINIVYGSDVSGNLTLHLAHVPFDEAFRTVLAMMNLSTMQVGSNILRILTPASLAKSQATAATVTKVLTLNYTKASDILAEVNSVNIAQGVKGTTLADAKTNSLIITAPLEAVVSTERLVKALDVRPKQVLIEVKLVEVSLNNNLNLGVQWDYQGVNNSNIGGQNGQNLIGTLTPPNALNSPTAMPFLTNPNLTNGAGATGVTPMAPGGALTTAVGSVARGLGVNLPASSIFGEMTLGRITSNYFLSATLSAAAAEGKLKVLSDPKIATLNNQSANINVTTQIPYVTTNIMPTAGAQSQTVTYVTTGIQLAVTPTINADGRITLLLNPNVSQPSVTVAGNSATGAPAIDSRIAQTTVLVRDGETIVIGGLIHDSVTDQVAKIPLLGDIPILGWLFKSKSVIHIRNELLIFVTPKILED